MAGRLLSTAELVQWLGIHRNTLAAWLQRGIPVAERGASGRGNEHRFDLAAVVRWREDQAAQSATGDTANLDIDETRLRKVAGEAALVEIEVAKARGELVEIDAVATAFGEQCANVRARLLPIPSKMAPLLASTSDVNEIQSLLEQGIHEALSELSGDGITGAPDQGDPGTDAGKPATAASAPRKRVGRRPKKAKP